MTCESALFFFGAVVWAMPGALARGHGPGRVTPATVSGVADHNILFEDFGRISWTNEQRAGELSEQQKLETARVIPASSQERARFFVGDNL